MGTAVYKFCRYVKETKTSLNSCLVALKRPKHDIFRSGVLQVDDKELHRKIQKIYGLVGLKSALFQRKSLLEYEPSTLTMISFILRQNRIEQNRMYLFHLLNKIILSIYAQNNKSNCNYIQRRTKQTTYRIGVSKVMENCISKKLGE